MTSEQALLVGVTEGTIIDIETTGTGADDEILTVGYVTNDTMSILQRKSRKKDPFYAEVKEAVQTLPTPIYAYNIKTSDGLICIDSKFPLDNYCKFLEAEEEEQDKYARRFQKDVKHRLDEVASKYVAPQKGTTDFAFAFIPSEGVYYYLIQHAYDLLQEYVEQGVQVVSPLTLLQRIQLIKAGIQVQKLTEKAKAIQAKLHELKARFERVEDKWDTFYRQHLKNAKNKAAELDQAYSQLREEFNKLYRLEDIEEDK